MAGHATLSATCCPASPGTVVVVLEGEAQLETAPVLARALHTAIAAAPELLVVDCSDLTFCTSPGLHELLAARSAAGKAGVAFRLAALSPQVDHLLHVTAADTIFDIQPTAPGLSRARETRGGTGVTGPEPTMAKPAGTGMCAEIAALVDEAAGQAEEGLWELSEEDAELARVTAARLAETVAPDAGPEELAGTERLERLRGAIATIAIAVAHAHGQIAWFLAQAANTLTPVLDWRALAAPEVQSFGTRVPSPGELADAENAVRRLYAALTANPAGP